MHDSQHVITLFHFNLLTAVNCVLITEAVTKHLLAKAVPLHVDDAEMHEKIISSVAQLEGFMENVGFSIDTSQGPFTSYVQRVRLHDQNRRRQVVRL